MVTRQGNDQIRKAMLANEAWLRNAIRRANKDGRGWDYKLGRKWLFNAMSRLIAKGQVKFRGGFGWRVVGYWYVSPAKRGGR